MSQQIHYTLQAREAEYELIPLSLDQKLGVLVWSPLAGGLLVRQAPAQRRPPGRHAPGRRLAEPPIADENKLWDIVDVLVDDRRGAQRLGRADRARLVARAAAVTTVIIGGRNEAQFKDNLGAANVKLTEEERARLDKVEPAAAALSLLASGVGGERPARPGRPGADRTALKLTHEKGEGDAPSSPARRGRMARSNFAIRQPGRISGVRSALQRRQDRLGRADARDARQGRLDGEAVRRFADGACRIFGDDDRVAELPGFARRLLDAEIGGDAGQHDRVEPAPPELQIEFRAVEGAHWRLTISSAPFHPATSGTNSIQSGGRGPPAIGWSTSCLSRSAPSAEKPTWTRTTAPPARVSASASRVELATTAAAGCGAIGMPRMPFCRSIATSAARFGSSFSIVFLSLNQQSGLSFPSWFCHGVVVTAEQGGRPARSGARIRAAEARNDELLHNDLRSCSRPRRSRPRISKGLRVQQIIAAIERMGFQVVQAPRTEDAEIAVQTDAAIGCIVVDWGKKGLEGKAASLINLMRRRGLEMPIVLLVRRKRFEDMPVEVLDFIDGYVFLAEETPEFIATQSCQSPQAICRNAEDAVFRRAGRLCRGGQPIVDLPRPQRRHLLQPQPDRPHFHASISAKRCSATISTIRSSNSATCSPTKARRLQAQKEAAAIFGAEKTYFVLNGTSASNKIVLGSLVAEGDLVLFDRNNHKAAHHGALLLAGGIPIFLPTDRNAHGLIGPIHAEAFDETAIREAIRANPLVKDPDAWRRERPFRVAVIEQCTYDGTIYNAAAYSRAHRPSVRLHPV